MKYNSEQENDELLFRRGFLIEIDPHKEPQLPNENWEIKKLGLITFIHHPETVVQSFSYPGATALIIGFCFGIGTSVKDAVDRMLSAGIDYSALNDLSGRFCLLIIKDKEIIAFNDSFGSQTLYYSSDCSGVFSSHSYLLAKHIAAPQSKKMKTLIKSDLYKGLSVKYLPGDLTYYENIHGLIPNHFLNVNTGKLTRYWPVASPALSCFDQFADRFESSLHALAKAVTGKKVYLGITGGIDTRVLMAGLTKAKCNIFGMTWLGNYHNPSEQTVIDDIVQRLELGHVTVDMPGPSNEISRISSLNNGGHRGQSRLTSGIAEVISCGPDDIFIRGYGGEIIRGFYNLLKFPMTSLDAKEQARMYFRKSSKKENVDSEIIDIVTDAFVRFSNIAGYQNFSADYNLDPNDIFYWEQRMGMWASGMLNEMDAAMYSIVGLNDRRLYEISFGLPRHERLSKTIFQRLIDRLEPRLSNLSVI